jgi:hypothetical protein
VTQVDRSNRGQLMDDHLRPRLLAARHAMNLMTGGNQTRHQLPSNRSRRSCHKLKGWVDGPPVIEHRSSGAMNPRVG